MVSAHHDARECDDHEHHAGEHIRDPHECDDHEHHAGEHAVPGA